MCGRGYRHVNTAGSAYRRNGAMGACQRITRCGAKGLPLLSEQSVALVVGEAGFLLPFVSLRGSLAVAIHVGIELRRPLVVFFSEVA